LPLAEFTVNNQPSETTGLSPFFTNKGFEPHYQFDLLLVVTNNINNQRALRTSKALVEIHNYLCTEINSANLYYQDNANNQ
jgi:hypothetical protein